MEVNTVSTVVNLAMKNRVIVALRVVQKPVPIQQPPAAQAIMHLTLARSNAAPAQDINVQLAAQPIT